MITISKTLRYSLLACSMVAIQACQPPPPATPVAAPQPASIEFRVVPDGRNPAGCRRFDTAFSRVHTFTATGTAATLTSAGGINVNMTQTSPRVYTSSIVFGGVSLNVDASAASSPKTLVVTEPRLGCRWTAITP